MKCFAFDFDGVLVDSYSCLPSVYKKLAEYFGIENDEFVKEAIMLEDKYDAMEIFDKRIWWKDFFKKYGIMNVNEAMQIYWDERIKESKIMENCVET
ncbi:MAG TPA: HAD family hydrolase, partial [Thermoplasmatales archaeon]|nr:HAD family hydrolase [Thermoplasmatales archaeon]